MAAADRKRAIGNGATLYIIIMDFDGSRRMTRRRRVVEYISAHAKPADGAAAAGLGTNDLISEKFRIPTRAVHNGLRICVRAHTI